MTTPSKIERAEGGHTAGPWSARLEWSSLCVVDDTGDYIADIHDRDTFDENLEVEDEDASKAEAEANARLIAAAPELLEALADFQAHVARHSCTWDEAENGSHHHPVWQKVADAIAKARGEA